MLRVALAREKAILLSDPTAPLHYALFSVSGMLVAAAALDQTGVDRRTALMAGYSLVLFFVQTLMVESVHRSDFATGLWQRIRLHGAIVSWYFGKIVTLTFLVLIMAAPLLWIGSQFMRVELSWTQLSDLAFCVGIGALGFFALALVLLPIAAATGRRSLFLPLLLFPLSFPLMLAGGQVNLALTGSSGIDAGFWLRLMLALGTLYVACGLVLIDTVYIGE